VVWGHLAARDDWGVVGQTLTISQISDHDGARSLE
jgi:hypothetical protein